MAKLSYCAIVKADDSEASILDRGLGYIKSYVDDINITITGKEGQAKEIELVCKKYKANISYFDWINDFAAARNFNFSQAKGDYIFWTDSDDIVNGVQNLPDMVKLMEEKGVDVGTMDYLYHFDESGLCDTKHRKSRIVKNDGCVKWYGEIHEDLLAEREINNYFIEDIQVMHLNDDKRIGESKKRNLDIALEVMQKRRDDPTAMWNVANAYAGLGQNHEAIATYKNFIEYSGSEDEVALAHHRMAYCYMDLEEFDKAKDEACRVIQLRPWFPDGYLTLGEIFFKLGKVKHAKEMLVQGLAKEIPMEEYIVWNPRDYDYNPLMLLAQCYIELGHPEYARKCLEECLKIYPDNKKVKDIIDTVDKEIVKLKKVDEICEKAKTIKDREELKKLLDTVPVELKSHPKISVIKNTAFIRKESTGKDLAIFCFATNEEFNPELIMKRGTGGSEEAVYQMSKRLHKLGWNVTVYANCGLQEKDYDGVIWKPYWDFNPRDKWDVIVAWRHPLLAGFPELNTENLYIWMHDVVKENEFTKDRLKKIKKIIVLSQYQRDLYPHIPDDKFIISSNGIDVESFLEKRGKLERNQQRLIYTSSYDRGLKTLLKLFPRIKKEVPEAELHVFYGWNTWDTMYKNDPVKQKEKKEMDEMMQQPGVVHHGRVSQEQIIDEYFKSSILAYPTEFTEISFITGMKAQAAGCLPVTTGIYAIDETVQYGLKMKSEKIYTDEFVQQKFVEGVVKRLKNPPTDKQREEMENWAINKFNWDTIAETWNNVFLEKQS